MNGVTNEKKAYKGSRSQQVGRISPSDNKNNQGAVEQLPLSHLKPHIQNHIFPVVDQRLKILISDIKQRGLLEPVIINTEHVIFSGHKRIEAVRQLGWKTVPVAFCDYSSHDALPFIRFNVQDHEADYATRIRVYEACSPEVLQEKLLPPYFIEKIASQTGLLASVIAEDRARFLSEENEITVSELKEAWGLRSNRIRLNILDSARGTIVQVRTGNFETESGPGPTREVMRDSYRKACSGLFDRSHRDFSAIGEKIARLRTEMGISQYALATLLGVSQPYLAECERGRYRSCEDILVSLQRLVADTTGNP